METRKNLTKHGVTYDIRNTPFTTLRNGFVWHFTSLKRQRKFESKAPVNEQWVNDGLSRRFKCAVHLPILADIQLYQQIETGGFYVTCHGCEYVSGLSMLVAADLSLMGADDA